MAPDEDTPTPPGDEQNAPYPRPRPFVPPELLPASPRRAIPRLLPMAISAAGALAAAALWIAGHGTAALRLLAGDVLLLVILLLAL